MPLWPEVLVALLAALALALRVAHGGQLRSVAAAAAALQERSRRQAAERVDAHSLASLPPPVLRYLNHALPADRRGLRLVRYEQQGILRTDPKSERWMAFTAAQVVAANTMEFLWTARVRVAPALHLQVQDSLLGGRGAGRVALLSAIPLATTGGKIEINSGALHRFLAEAVWYPSALLPSAHLSWAAVDDSRAVATLTDGTTKVSLEFRFNASDEVAGIYTPGRWGAFDGSYRQVAWEGRFGSYSRRDGVLVPSEGEVGWYADGEWRPVWRGTVVSTAMEFQ